MSVRRSAGGDGASPAAAQLRGNESVERIAGKFFALRDRRSIDSHGLERPEVGTRPGVVRGLVEPGSLVDPAPQGFDFVRGQSCAVGRHRQLFVLPRDGQQQSALGAAPGTTAARPDLPPLSRSARRSTRRLLSCVSLPWHSKQCCERIGRTSRSKLTAGSAAAAVAAPSATTAAASPADDAAIGKRKSDLRQNNSDGREKPWRARGRPREKEAILEGRRSGSETRQSGLEYHVRQRVGTLRGPPDPSGARDRGETLKATLVTSVIVEGGRSKYFGLTNQTI